MFDLLKEYIINQYKLTPQFYEWKLSSVHLRAPRFYYPTADESTLICWQRVLGNCAGNLPGDVSKSLSQVVKLTTHEEAEFDFGRIDTFTRSKSFGRSFNSKINGSWFRNVAEWGKGMYPSFDQDEEKNFSALDEQDFKRNIHHIEHKEGFISGSKIDVRYYAWYDRFVAPQTGGSHHAALAIYQIRYQKRHYTREAIVKSYQIDLAPVNRLKEKYWLFVIDSKSLNCVHEGEYYKDVHYIFQEVLNIEVALLYIENSVDKDAVIVCIEKKEVLHSGVFERWYQLQVEENNIIPLATLLGDTMAYCNTRYEHELNNIYLGDPSRENDIIAKPFLR